MTIFRASLDCIFPHFENVFSLNARKYGPEKLWYGHFLQNVFSRETRWPMTVLFDQWHWIYFDKWLEEDMLSWIGRCKMINWNIDFMQIFINVVLFCFTFNPMIC